MSKFEEVQRRKARKRQLEKQQANRIKEQLKNMGMGKKGSEKRRKRVELLMQLAKLEG